ncbi:MAG: hypothetical protein PHU85_00675 [Phycisphaerae bacterium]|nr:hypothetical protein [Phycisphaerae bacterium]
MSKPAVGEDEGATRWLRNARKAGWSWQKYRCGIVVKTPPNSNGRRGTTIWYGEHVVTWDMIRTRPEPYGGSPATPLLDGPAEREAEMEGEMT